MTDLCPESFTGDGITLTGNRIRNLDGTICDQEDGNEDGKLVGPSPLDFAHEIIEKGSDVVADWHEKLMKDPPGFDAFLDSNNASKNRYPNVLLYDRTRIKLKDKLGDDYYHASWVDSYDKRSGFALVQAPFDEDTEGDFWRLVLGLNPMLIVLLAGMDRGECEKRDCRHFWPRVAEEKDFFDGQLKVKTCNVDKDFDTDTYDLTVQGPGRKGKSSVRTQMLHYKKWTDDRVVPDNLMEFRAMMKIQQARAEKDEFRGKGPTMLICPTGCHRAGSMAVLDIVLDRLTAEKRVGLPDTVVIVHMQRYGVMTHFEHYSVIANLITRHAVSSGMVDTKDIGIRKRNRF